MLLSLNAVLDALSSCSFHSLQLCIECDDHGANLYLDIASMPELGDDKEQSPVQQVERSPVPSIEEPSIKDLDYRAIAEHAIRCVPTLQYISLGSPGSPDVYKAVHTGVEGSLESRQLVDLPPCDAHKIVDSIVSRVS